MVHGSVWFALGYAACRLHNYYDSALVLDEGVSRLTLALAVLGPCACWLVAILLPMSLLASKEMQQVP